LASLGHPSKFQRVSRLASLLQRRRSPASNQTLHDVWPSPALPDYRYIYIFGVSCSLTEFCPVQNSLYVQVLRSCIMAALLHGTPAAGVNQTLQRGTRNGILLCICVCFCLLLHYNANKGLYTRMWANAQPDGRPAEHRWRPLFNAPKFG